MRNQQDNSAKLFLVLNYLGIFLLLIFFLGLFGHRITAFTQDLGRHLKLGEIILAQKKIPQVNLFSYTFPQFPFINHHWLSEVIFYFFYKWFGTDSLIFLKAIILGLAFFPLFVYRQKRVGWPISLGSGWAVLLLFQQRTEIRPEIFSYFFLSIYLLLLDEEKLFKKYFWVLPLIQILWVNIHIYFFLGPALVFLYFAASMFYPSQQKKWKKKLITLTLICLGCLLNPHFFKGALYPLYVFKNYGYQVVENQSLLFMTRYYGGLYFPYFFFVFVLVLLTFIFSLINQSVFSIVSFVLFSGLAFGAIRNIPLFGLGVYLPATRNIFLIKVKLLKKLGENGLLNLKLLFYFLFLPAIAVSTFRYLSGQVYLKQYSNKRFGLGVVKGCQAGVDFLKTNQVQGPVFNNFDIGSFLIYSLYPQQMVFVDGRPEAYPADFFEHIYILTQENEAKWQEIDQRYNFNYIFFSHTDVTPWAVNFLKRISRDQNWQLVFLDDYAIIFLKKNEINQPVLEKFSLDVESFSFSCQEIDCYVRVKRILALLEEQK